MWVQVGADDLIDQLPTGLLVIDRVGTIRYANALMLRQLGWSANDAIGASVFDTIVEDDLDFAAEIIADAASYDGALLGPLRIGYYDAAGRRHFTECWARELADRTGYVMSVPVESTSDALADAARAIARSAPVEETVGHIVASLTASPMDALGCVLRVVGDELVPLAPWPLGDDGLLGGDRATPWSSAVRSGLAVDVDDVDRLDQRLRDRMISCGFAAMWCRPVIDHRDAVSAVVVVFLADARPPSPNQRRRLDDVVDTMALAFDQNHSKLERAAFTDPLTGAGTRTRLHREMEAGISGCAVVYLDLDGFKGVNDTHGHGAGDQVLRDVALRLTAIVRPRDLVIRAGGDEFVLVIRAVCEFDGLEVAATIVDELARPYAVLTGDVDTPISVTVTASVGLCVQGDATPFDVALRAADDALTGAKRAGKHRMHIVSR